MDEHDHNLQGWFDFLLTIIFVILLYLHYLPYKTYLFSRTFGYVWNYEHQRR